MPRRHALSICAAAVLWTADRAPAQAHREPPTRATPTSFALVVDAATWAAIPGPIRAYRAAVEADELGTWILADDWTDPAVVRAALRALHAGERPLEGALLVGRIPVPMLRGAQHLTTAFKMDEGQPRQRSSVPSDRFYEDFDLVWRPLGADESDPRLAYFELAPESPQRVEKEIYTARLAPPLDGAAGEAAIAACLERFVRLRGRPQVLDRALTLMGHGYVSESLDAWADARTALVEQLPALRRPGGTLVALNHLRGPDLEKVLSRELADPAYDLAILHSHGDDDRQFLIGALPLPTAAAQVDELRRHARAQLRRARARGQSEAEAKLGLMERHGIPLAWFDRAFDAAVTAADEALDARTELTAAEVESIAPGAEVIHLDACFNGNIVARPYQAAAYLFGDGETAVVVANSVNVAQDVDADRGIALLGLGERVGRWHLSRPHLESHLFGDPTFRFAAPARPPRVARRLLGLPGLRDEDLVGLLRAEPASALRLEALGQLARRRSPAFEDALPLAARDPSELVRRRAIALIGDLGRADQVEVLVRAALRDPSERVAFDAREAAKKLAPHLVEAAVERVLAAEPAAPEALEREALLQGLRPGAFVTEDLAAAADRSRPADQRARSLRTYRLYRAHPALPGLLELARAADEAPEVRIAALEALGWYVFAAGREAVIEACGEIAAEAGCPPAVRGEALKTAGRLRAGANDPLLP
jgi:hypothetical protein